MAGRILVLDDEENYAEMLQDLLREHNYQVDMATRPERAILQLEEIPYDLVISDYKMPVMDGSDFLRKARELYPNLPVILVSGLMNTPELVKVANMSVTLVMEKPLDIESFLREVARFSDPMTDEEKDQLSKNAEKETEVVTTLSFPEEPRYFSVSNALSNRFLHKAWTLAKNGSELFIHEPPGGDAENVLRDLSVWKGNGDSLVDVIRLPGSNPATFDLIRETFNDLDKSRLIGIRINTTSEVVRMRQLTQLVKSEMPDFDSLLLVYIITSDTGTKDFVEATGDFGVVLPPLCRRPSDLAVYARRMARIASDRVSRSRCCEFSPEAVDALLAYEWPENYKQLHQVIQAAVVSGEDQPITLDEICEALGERIEPTAPEDRIGALLKAEQRRYIESQLELSDCSAADLAKQLELDASTQTIDDLKSIPLLRQELAIF